VTSNTENPARELEVLIEYELAQAGGWIGFDRFMALALYAPNLGYYSARRQPIGLGLGRTPSSDFVTAPQMSPWFSRTLAHSVREALETTSTRDVWEFGAGTGEMAFEILSKLGERIERYTIVDLSAGLKESQRQRLLPFKDKVRWVSELPAAFEGVVLGNEVLDAMPVKLLVKVGSQWFERGVSLENLEHPSGCPWVWSDRKTALRPPIEIDGDSVFEAGATGGEYLTEIHPQAHGFIRTLAERLKKGVIFLIDYGFPEHEYYHPDRSGGTVMCHALHRADTNPLVHVGLKDITAHVNFTGIALSAQEAGLAVLGYTSQAHFLINSGLLPLIIERPVSEKAMAQKLITEHEMGELFKVIALGAGLGDATEWSPMGFSVGDRTHQL
jgi:SAM-dependent MidA family methyltransferase